jgi:hypothetical protein
VGNETLLRCVDCGAENDGLAKGWRAYRVADLDEREESDREIFFTARIVLGGSSGRCARNARTNVCS